MRDFDFGLVKLSANVYYSAKVNGTPPVKL